MESLLITPMDAKAIQEAIDNGKRYVSVTSRRYQGIVQPVVSLLYDATAAAQNLQEENKRLREALSDIATSMKYATIETPTDEIVSILQARVTYLRDTAKEALEPATAPADAAEGE